MSGAAFAFAASAEPVDLALALTDLRHAYTNGITQERVDVTIRKVPGAAGAGAGGGQTWKEQFVVRIDPGQPRNQTGIACLLELGELRVWWCAAGIADGDRAGGKKDNTDPPPSPVVSPPSPTLIAVHERDTTSCYLASIEGLLTPAKLDKAMMPVPAPQLALAFADEKSLGISMHGLTAYTPDITWESASRDERKAPNDVAIVGYTNPSSVQAGPGPGGGGGNASKPGKVTLITDFGTGRLKRFTAEIDDGRLELDLRVKPEPALPRAQWGISRNGRQPVTALADLGPKPGDAAGSKTVPEMILLTLDDLPWDFHEALRAAPPAPPQPPLPAGTAGDTRGTDRLVLLFMREREPSQPVPTAKPDQPAGDRGNEFANPDAEAGLAAINAILKEHAGKPQPKPPPPGVPEPAADAPSPLGRISQRVVLVAIKTDGKTRERIASGAKRWGDAIVWSSSPISTIDRFAPGASAVIVVVKAPQSLCGVIRLDGRKSETKTIEQELREALACHGKAQAP